MSTGAADSSPKLTPGSPYELRHERARPATDVQHAPVGAHPYEIGKRRGELTRVPPHEVGAANVAAVDPSQPFVAAAAERHPGVAVQRAAAGELPYGDDAFGAALAQLVVRFMSDAVAGLREMARVTRAGGIVAASVWDLAGGRAPMSPFWRAVRDLRADVEDEAGRAGTRAGQLGELFEAAGLSTVDETELAASVEYETFEDWWRPYTLGVGPAGKYVAELDADDQAQLREHCRELLPRAPFTVKAVAWAARGVT